MNEIVNDLFWELPELCWIERVAQAKNFLRANALPLCLAGISIAVGVVL